MDVEPSSSASKKTASRAATDGQEMTFAQVVRDLSTQEKALLRATGRSDQLDEAMGLASDQMPPRDMRVPHLPVISAKAISLMTWRAKKTLARELGTLRLSKRGLPPSELPDKPVLVYCNVASPWARELAMLLAWRYWPSLVHYSPMLRSEASRYTFRFKAGFFPVAEGPAGLRDLMRTGRQVLACPGHVLWMGATSGVTDVRLAPPPVNRVVTQLVRKAQDIVLLPMAVEHPYRIGPRPEVMVRFGRLVHTTDAGRRTGHGWQQLLSRRLGMVQHRLAQEVMEGDMDAFETVPW